MNPSKMWKIEEIHNHPIARRIIMQRRIFLKSLVTALSALPLVTLAKRLAAAATPNNREILLQTSPVAGFQFYDGDQLWTTLRPNDRLQLVPEPENLHDNQAVKVMWNGDQLGYVPRRDNTAISQMLNRRQPLVAKIGELRQSTNPWDRMTMNIYLVQG
jgi:hypothetical protein